MTTSMWSLFSGKSIGREGEYNKYKTILLYNMTVQINVRMLYEFGYFGSIEKPILLVCKREPFSFELAHVECHEWNYMNH